MMHEDNAREMTSRRSVLTAAARATLHSFQGPCNFCKSQGTGDADAEGAGLENEACPRCLFRSAPSAKPFQYRLFRAGGLHMTISEITKAADITKAARTTKAGQ